MAGREQNERSSDTKAGEPPSTQPSVLNYASPDTPREPRVSWPAGAECMIVAACMAAAAKWMGDDIGSGRMITNPLTVLLVVGITVCAAGYCIERIVREQHVPTWTRFVSGACTLVALVVVWPLYMGWNHAGQIPSRHNHAFWTAWYVLVADISFFALVRCVISVKRRRHRPEQSKK